MRRILAIALLAALGGCQQVQEYTLTDTEKISRAFPPPPEVLAMRAGIEASLAGEPAAARQFAQQFGQLLDVRAVTCRGTTTISRLDSVAAVRGKLADKDCFRKQDAELAQWLGLRRLAMLAAQPPLRPLQPLPARAVVPGVDGMVQLSVASGAGVALARTGGGRYATLDLGGGQPIHQFSGPGDSYRPPALSPNGRLAAFAVGNRSLQVLDLESGATVWSSDKYAEVLAWMPAVEALLVLEAGGRKPALLDLRTGAARPYVADERPPTWALELPGTPQRWLVGSASGASLVEHARKPDGSLGVELRQQWPLQRTMNVNTPMLLREGRLLVWPAHPDLGWLDLATGQQGSWATSVLRIANLAKFDERRLAWLDHSRAYAADGPGRPALRLLDVEDLTVATAADVQADGYPLSFAPRSGYARHLNGSLVVVTQAQAQDPQPLDKVLADANLQDQLRKVEAAQGAEAAAAGRTVYGRAEIAAAEAEAQAAQAAVARAETQGLQRTQREAYIALVARAVRLANVVAQMRDGLPREVVERTRIQGLRVAGAPERPAPARPAPMLADVPANAEVAVLGVYEAENDRRQPGQPRTPGTVFVSLGQGPGPLVLVLSSYEPVRWVVVNGAGRRVAAVLLSGYHPSEVQGLQGVQVLRIGQQSAYKLDSPAYARLKEDVARYVAAPVRSFQGSYKAARFQVGS